MNLRRRGFTLIELLTVVVILGLLSSLAVLKYIDLTRTAYTAKIVGEFLAVRLAAYNFEADHNNHWPADEAPGVVPPEMAAYLPGNFSFVAPTYVLDWDNLSPDNTPYQLAISVTTNDARLQNALVQNLGHRAPYFFAGNRLTYVLVDAHGNY